MPNTGYFHLHLVSDATGETLITVARAAAVVSWIMRGIPPLVILFVAYFVFPEYGINLSPMVAAILGFAACNTFLLGVTATYPPTAAVAIAGNAIGVRADHSDDAHIETSKSSSQNTSQ